MKSDCFEVMKFIWQRSSVHDKISDFELEVLILQVFLCLKLVKFSNCYWLNILVETISLQSTHFMFKSNLFKSVSNQFQITLISIQSIEVQPSDKYRKYFMCFLFSHSHLKKMENVFNNDTRALGIEKSEIFSFRTPATTKASHA